MAKLLRLGRIVALLPAELGSMFEDYCTVTLVKEERPSRDNGWKKIRVQDPRRLWWYDKDGITQQEAFCTLAGYETHIRQELAKINIPVEVEQRTQSGLHAPDFTRIGPIQLRTEQREMLVKICANNTGVLVAATGAGKSTLIKLLARIYHDDNIVITVPSVDVARDLYESLTSAPDIAHEIGFVGDGEKNFRRVTVAITHSVDKCHPDTSLVLCDEAHMMLTEWFIKKLNVFRRAKFFAFTATDYGKSDGSDGYMEALFGKVLAESDYQDSVDARSVVPIRVIKVASTTGPSMAKDAADHVKEAMCITRNDARNRLIAATVQDLRKQLGPDKQVLVMVSKVEHAYRLQQLLPDFVVVTGKVDTDRVQELVDLRAYNPSTQTLCTDEMRNTYKRQFASGELKYAIANSVWERGVDFKDLAALVRCDGAASRIKAVQITGRLSRIGSDGQKPEGILIDFYDSFDEGYKRKAAKRFAEYRSQGWKVENASTKAT